MLKRKHNFFLFKKVRIGISFFALVGVCVFTGKFLILLNYFLALGLHEMAHLFAATTRGYKLKQFKLDMLGMSLELDADIDGRDNFFINLAGPIFNLFLAICCMAVYWLLPNSYQLLNCFCVCNLILAVFNLLPIYPLDGGKIFRGLIKKDSTYKKLDLIIRLIFTAFFVALFVFSIFNKTNWFYLVMATFFVLSHPKKSPTFSIFKTDKEKQFQTVRLIKVDGQDNLYSLIKRINKQNYTIFYFNNPSPRYIDEDTIISYATRYPLKTKLFELPN